MQLQLQTIVVLLLLLSLIVSNVVGNNNTTCTQYRMIVSYGTPSSWQASTGHFNMHFKTQLLKTDKSVTLHLSEHMPHSFILEHIFRDKDEAQNKILRNRYISSNDSSFDFDNKFSELLQSTMINYDELRTNNDISGSVWEYNLTDNGQKWISREQVRPNGTEPLVPFWLTSLNGGPSLFQKISQWIIEEDCVTTLEPATSSTTAVANDTSTSSSTISVITAVETTSVTELLTSSSDYGTTASTTSLKTTSTYTSTTSPKTDSKSTSTTQNVTSASHDDQTQATTRVKERQQRPFSTTADKVYSVLAGVLIVGAIVNFIQIAGLMQP